MTFCNDLSLTFDGHLDVAIEHLYQLCDGRFAGPPDPRCVHFLKLGLRLLLGFLFILCGSFTMSLPLLLFGACLAQATALPRLLDLSDIDQLKVQEKQEWLKPVPLPIVNGDLVLPMDDRFPSQRTEQVRKQRLGFLYGPSLLGNSSYFPTGAMGNAMVQEHQDLWFQDSAAIVEAVAEEMASAAAAVREVCLPDSETKFVTH